ncbi:MAG TPA: 4Fe-4S dicluster domain-containing protein [Syntrophobacteraceae bacterium]|nr:4Fe-4S dicluster domain-containing protein [Syntrophobacteraceae bacterium]
MDKCNGCAVCGQVVLTEDSRPKEAEGLLWVDRIRISESKCIHCGDCVDACIKESPEKQGMTNIVVQRLRAVTGEGGPHFAASVESALHLQETESLTTLQKMFLMSKESRKAFWDQQFSKCIKCYGCIDICPVYEDSLEGFDLSKEIASGEVPPPYPLFHFLRAYNVWDTCVGCGECEKTCPSDIPLKAWQDMIVRFSPEQVFELVPGLEDEHRKKIIALVEKRRGAINDAA